MWAFTHSPLFHNYPRISHEVGQLKNYETDQLSIRSGQCLVIAYEGYEGLRVVLTYPKARRVNVELNEGGSTCKRTYGIDEPYERVIAVQQKHEIPRIRPPPSSSDIVESE